MLIAVAVVIGVVVLLGGFIITGFNKLRTADVAVDEALGGIDVQLTRRADLIPNLVETVKGYAQHERGVFEEVTKARAGIQEAVKGADVAQKAAADAALEKAIIDVNAVAEAYPDLKANQNFQQLQTELTNTENELAFARRYYNDAAASLNTMVRTIPWMFFTGIAGVHKRDFYDAPEGQENAPTVSFDTQAAPPAVEAPAAPAPAPEAPSTPPAPEATTPPLPPEPPAAPPAPPAPPQA